MAGPAAGWGAYVLQPLIKVPHYEIVSLIAMDPVSGRAMGLHLLGASMQKRTGLQGSQRVRIQLFVPQLCGPIYKFY